MPRRRVLLIVFLAAVLVGVAVFWLYLRPTDTTPPLKIDLTALVTKIHRSEVARLRIGSTSVEVDLRNGIALVVDIGSSGAGSFLGQLRTLGVTEEELSKIELIFLPPSIDWPWILAIAAFLALGFGFFRWRSGRQGGPAGSPAGSGRFGGSVSEGSRPRETFEDVGGCDEAIQDLKEVVEFLKKPARFLVLGARVPKGVLLVGPPGCGKTLLARAVAGEAEVPFFFVSGSEFVEMFVGVGASRVRELFAKAKKSPSAIVFIDEIDTIGGVRSGAGTGGDREYQQTLNQILTEMDGFEADAGIVVLAATNRPDMLDPALTRKGRFDRMVVVDRPDLNGRKKIFEIHLKGKPLAEGVDSLLLAKATSGFTGADIESTANEAAILAARQGKTAIEMKDFGDAVERVIAGPERKSRKISAEEKEITAYHEAGHALVMAKLPLCLPVHKVSIISRGLALGYTIGLPEEDHYLQSKEELEQNLAGILGGRAAEELRFGKDRITTGASNDLERATAIAREMVVRFGMSELGLQSFVVTREDYLRRGQFGEAGMSPETAYLVEKEIDRLVSEAYAKAKEILTEGRELLTRVAKKLIEEETLDADRFAALIAET